MLPAALRQRVAANSEFLGFGQFDFDPRTAALVAFVGRIFSFGDQALEAQSVHGPSIVRIPGLNNESR